MSRSYKKTPIVKAKDRTSQKLAARSVRRSDELPQRGAYKKMYQSWDVIDYTFRWTEQDALDYYQEKIRENDTRFLKHYPTLEKWMRTWYKAYKGK